MNTIFCKIVSFFLISISALSNFYLYAQQNNSMDATFIGKNYYNSIVKILLIDSMAEKQKPGSGYLGRGSGFLVTEDGVIFTNRHVIELCIGIMRYSYYNKDDKTIYNTTSQYDASALSNQSVMSIHYVIGGAVPIVQVYNSKNGDDYTLYYAKIIATDTSNFDGAILKIVSDIDGNPVSKKFHPLPIGNSDSTNQGEDLCIYGFPAQFDAGFELMLKDQSTLTFGKHSGFDYVFNPYYGYIKTDASINSGNSGGPVFNSTNKVIGIATAASTKTNIGLVGGINAMYDLASLQPELLKQLSVKGLAKPSKAPPVKTVTLTRTPHLPVSKTLKQSNAYKKTVRKLKGGMWYVKGFYPMIQKDKFTIEDNDIDPGIVITTGNPLNVKMNSGLGTEIGHLFTLWRIHNDYKLSLDYTILNITVDNLDFSQSNIYKDTANSAIFFLPKVQFIKAGMGLGLNFSYLFFKQFVLEGYYKFYVGGDSQADFAKVENELITSNRYYGQAYIYRPAFLMHHSLGFNVRHDFYFLGLEYSFENGPLEYGLSYATNNKYFDGTKYINNYSWRTTEVYGSRKTNTVNLTAGVTFGGGKKWKRLVGKGKWEMDSK